MKKWQKMKRNGFIDDEDKDKPQDYKPSEETEESEISEEDESETNENISEYIIFHSQLLQLLSLLRCPECAGMDTNTGVSASVRPWALSLLRIKSQNCDGHSTLLSQVLVWEV